MDFYTPSSEAHKKREKDRARKLKISSWWQNKLCEGLCYYCQSRFPKELLTMDHKVPIARGGRSTKSNVVVCCKECNTHKAHQTPAELILNSSK